jgi:hypothetical protein
MATPIPGIFKTGLKFSKERGLYSILIQTTEDVRVCFC